MDKYKSTSDQVTLTEHLSALLDDETGSFEQRRVLDELKVDDKLCQKLSSYALIGESMRSENAQMTATSSFLSGIHEQIKAEPEYNQVQLEESQSSSKTITAKSSWLRPIGGFAMAASVAAIAVLGVQNYQSNSSPMMNQDSVINVQMAPAPTKAKDQLSLAEMKSAKIVSAAKMAVVNDSTLSKAKVGEVVTYAQADARTRSFLKRYVDSHMQYASTTTFVPSVRVIAYADY